METQNLKPETATSPPDPTLAGGRSALRELLVSPYAIAVGMVLVFLADCITPLGLAIWAAYPVFVLSALAIESSRAPVVIAAAATVLITVGYFMSPAGIPAAIAGANRVIGLTLLWGTVVLVSSINRRNRKLAEQRVRLHREEEQAQLFIQAVKDYALYMMDSSGVIVSWNAGAERIKGYQASEILGCHYSVFFTEEDRRLGKPQSILNRAQQEDHVNEVGWRVRKDGTRFFADATVTTLRDKDGVLRGFAKITRDVTERREAEEQLHRLNESLDHRVRERTQELEQANEALEAFGYSVSHDLRAPLRTMQGFAQALLEDYGEALGPEARDYAMRITRGAQRMDAIILDLLAYSRLSRTELVLHPVDLQSVLRDVADQLATPLQESSAMLEVEAGLPLAVGHRGTLVQIFSNLVSNALKFVAPGVAPIIRVSAERRDDRVRVFVTDNGIGIEPEHQARIFRVFERLHGSEAYPGTGIGLAIVKRGAERLGGSVGVEAVPHQGSCFWVELRAA